MLKLLKNSFFTTNDCIILANPLIIFLSILSWYFNYLILSVDNFPKIILGGITLIVMFCGFFSAWLYMSKKVISLSSKIFVFDKDRAKALLSIILSSTRGIGKLFLPILFVTLVSLIDFWLIFYFFSKFKILMSVIILVYVFILLFWVLEIVYCQRNPLKALKSSILNIYLNFGKSIFLFVYLLFLSGIIYILNLICAFNPVLYFFILLIFYYFLVYVTVLLFIYYEQTFIRN